MSASQRIGTLYSVVDVLRLTRHTPSPLASSMFAPGIPRVMRDFHSNSDSLATFVVSVYVLGFAIGPLLVAPLSEMYGRIPLYFSNFVLFVVFTIACAVSSNLSMLIGFRFLQGCVGSAPLTIGGGTIADLMPQERRGGALAIWAMGPLLGPVIGPVAGGYLVESKVSKTWRKGWSRKICRPSIRKGAH